MRMLQRLIDAYRLRRAVQESLDKLPAAVCYFTASGYVKLCNTAMYKLYRKLAQSELQSFAELTEVLENCDMTTGIIREGNVYLFPDGHAWLFSANEITTEDGRRYTEAVFSDVTELYEKRRELEKQSKELKLISNELKALADNMLEVTREQEILNMKSFMHDRMNMGIAGIRQMLRQDSPAQKNTEAIEQLRSAVNVLREENTGPRDELSEFLRDARIAGIRVEISGSLPAQAEPGDLVMRILRESCANAAGHADASVLLIRSELKENSVILRITNNGNPPQREISPRGGLADLKKRILQAGGSIRLKSLPEFELEVTLPAGAVRGGKET